MTEMITALRIHLRRRSTDLIAQVREMRKPPLTDAELADLMKAEADRKAESDPPDNAQADLAQAMQSEPDLGRKDGKKSWIARIKTWWW
jgi:hypothetical protein